jgi:GH24 family phage-related lysozyme (muramidase)
MGIPNSLIEQWFASDIAAAIEIAEAIFGDLSRLPDPVARALVNMAFDLGHELRDWHHLIAALSLADWKGAARSILNSRFAMEAPERCKRLADRICEACE